MKKYQIFCISAGRENDLPFSEAEMEHIHFITDKPYKVPHNTIGGGLVDSRNLALEMAFERGLNCVQLSDDLVKVTRVVNQARGEKVPLLDAIDCLQGVSEKTTANLIGVPPTNNPYFCMKKYLPNTFIIGDAFLAKPSSPRFDKNLRLKEVYDFSAQHMVDKGTLRVQSMVWDFKHYSNNGGAVAYRDDVKEKQAIAYLMNKWPKRFRTNPRRKNEILMK